MEHLHAQKGREETAQLGGSESRHEGEAPLHLQETGRVEEQEGVAQADGGNVGRLHRRGAIGRSVGVHEGDGTAEELRKPLLKRGPWKRPGLMSGNFVFGTCD